MSTTQISISQKEKEALQDALEHEQMCMIKYQNYSNQLQDPQLKSLFQDLYQREEQHYQTIQQLLQKGGF